MSPRILLVNPWIHDFSAYDFWLRPLALYRLGAAFRAAGFDVDHVDLLDRDHPALGGLRGKHRKGKPYGCGHFYSEPIPKPQVLAFVPSRFRRYGLPPSVAEAEISSRCRPDAIGITSMMTYWYTGAEESIRLCRKVFPGVPIYLGGVYADLLPDHARKNTGADVVLSGQSHKEVVQRISQDLGHTPSGLRDEDRPWLFPAYDLTDSHQYLPVMTSEGCPYRCRYCASPILAPRLIQYPPADVVRVIVESRRKWGTRDFAFYDDAILFRSRDHILPILDDLVGRNLGLRLHFPNALHGRFIDKDVARALKSAGTKTIRIGLEFSDVARQTETGGKIDTSAYREAVSNLLEAGFTGRELATYLLLGYPGQTLASVKETADFVFDCRAQVRIALYAPIPGTPDWLLYPAEWRFDPRTDPLLTNDSLAPHRSRLYTSEEYQKLKLYIADRNLNIQESKST